MNEFASARRKCALRTPDACSLLQLNIPLVLHYPLFHREHISASTILHSFHIHSSMFYFYFIFCSCVCVCVCVCDQQQQSHFSLSLCLLRTSAHHEHFSHYHHTTPSTQYLLLHHQIHSKYIIQYTHFARAHIYIYSFRFESRTPWPWSNG